MSAIDSGPLLSGAGGDPFPAFSQRRRRGVRVTTAAAVALGLALGGGAVVGATTPTPATGSGPSASAGRPGATGGPGGTGTPPVAVGTVQSVGADTFTLTTRDSTTVTVDVTSATTYFDPGITSPTMANVTVGERVAVFGTSGSGSSGTVTATQVAIGVPNGGPGGPGGDHDGPPSGQAS